MAANDDHEEVDAGRLSNPIACGPCRQKKRKCDRRLPHCLQCNDQPSLCQYPEQNKRGIPIGFINRLEARLVETEDALLRVLHSISPGSADALPSRSSSQQSKSSKIKEWDSLPLQSMDDIKEWYRLRTGVVLSSASLGPEQYAPHPHPLEFDSTTTASVQISSPVSTSHIEMLSQAGSSVAAPDCREAPRQETAVVANASVEGKAERVRKSQAHIYF
ncbi:hypothetical protein B0I35DRAFT_443794 [Stachybotrys elegans]|uniref:Zn(2)-C6 fungal-type domain-containing protein n=1 Tax=Stachybotrys elegans TaxID=80388 RepID=A0A8K0SG79_9HYPO|nr:hypothetical protein B0I35DRAFT_443794 [Stachybotrys elegans]